MIKTLNFLDDYITFRNVSYPIVVYSSTQINPSHVVTAKYYGYVMIEIEKGFKLIELCVVTMINGEEYKVDIGWDLYK